MTGEPAALPELPVQYLDYALWQYRWLASDDYRRQLEYWKRELDGAPLVLELPTDRPRPAVQTFAGASHHVLLPADVTEAMRQFVRPVVFLDAIWVKVRDNHVVAPKPAYVAVGIDTDGDKHVLGIYIAKTPLEEATGGETSRFWAGVMADLRARGVRDILICCTDGLPGFEDAVHSAFPATTVQRCTVHIIRNGLRPVARKDRDAVAKEFRKIYSASSADAALDALAEFSGSSLGKKYPRSVKVWEDAWETFTPFFAFTPGVRKLLYTTNSIESLNYQLRKVTKNRGHFPSDDAAVKLLWLAIVNIEDKRARERAANKAGTGKRHDHPARLIEGQRSIGWREALTELDTTYPGRIK